MSGVLGLLGFDDPMVMGAKYGNGIGSDVYLHLNPTMLRAPRNLLEAYEQAAYFLAVGARRAFRDNNTAGGKRLVTVIEQMQAEAERVTAQVNLLCSYTGLLCPTGGTGDVLDQARDSLESSGLDEDDTFRLTRQLKSNKTGFQIKRVVPVVSAIALGAALGAWWWHSRRG